MLRRGKRTWGQSPSLGSRWLLLLVVGACSAAERGADPSGQSVPPAVTPAGVDPTTSGDATQDTTDAFQGHATGRDGMVDLPSIAPGPIGDAIDDRIDDAIDDRPDDAIDDRPDDAIDDPSPESLPSARPREALDLSALVLSPLARERIEAIVRKVDDDAPSPIPVLPRRAWLRHRLGPREQLDQIAHRYGVDGLEMRAWNELPADVQELPSGSRIKIRTARVPPPRDKTTYTVASGDSWWSVALRHGVDARDVRAYNYPSRGKMVPGAALRIWIDPVVKAWIAAGDDPLPDDEAFGLRRGGVSVGRPDDGWLTNGVRLPKGEGYHLRLPKSAYGTSHAVAQILVGLTIFRDRNPDAPALELGAMSRPRGGEIGGHKSHQSGRDLDIRLPRRRGVPSWVELTPRRIDWLATWQLIEAMLQVDTHVIFLDYDAQKHLYRAVKASGVTAERLTEVLQYPYGQSAAGTVRHSPGHDKHLHVRVGCGPYEVECVQ